MRRFAMAVCAGALGISLVACGGGGSAADEPAATQEVGTDAQETSTETTEENTEVAADEAAGTPESDAEIIARMAKSMLYPLVNDYSAKDGMHMAYTVRMTYAGEDGAEGEVINLAYDKHIKGDTAFWRTTSLDDADSIWNGTSAVWDGNLVKLDEETHTGKIVIADYVSSDKGEDDILWEAVPFNEAYVRMLDQDFTVEEREVEGTTYTVEVHPQVDDYIRQEAFYFDEDGNLAYLQIYRLGPDDSDPEQFITIESWDKNVDESLLDLSGYEITELDI